MKSVIIEDNIGNTLQIHNQSLIDLGYLVSAPISGLESPNIRLSSYNKPGEHGAVVSNQLYANRRISIEGIIRGDVVNHWQRRRDLEQILKINRDSDNQVIRKTVKIVNDDDLSLQFDAVVDRQPLLPIKQPFSTRFLIDLFAERFALESQTLDSETIEPPIGGGAELPWEMPVLFAAVTGGSESIINVGNAEAFPIITLNGPLTNPRVKNITTGKIMHLILSIANGAQVVIDLGGKTIIQGAVTNQIDKKTDESEWWELEPGSNNILLSTSSSGDTGNAVIEHRSAYLGI